MNDAWVPIGVYCALLKTNWHEIKFLWTSILTGDEAVYNIQAIEHWWMDFSIFVVSIALWSEEYSFADKFAQENKWK